MTDDHEWVLPAMVFAVMAILMTGPSLLVLMALLRTRIARTAWWDFWNNWKKEIILILLLTVVVTLLRPLAEPMVGTEFVAAETFAQYYTLLVFSIVIVVAVAWHVFRGRRLVAWSQRLHKCVRAGENLLFLQPPIEEDRSQWLEHWELQNDEWHKQTRCAIRHCMGPHAGHSLQRMGEASLEIMKHGSFCAFAHCFHHEQERWLAILNEQLLRLESDLKLLPASMRFKLCDDDPKIESLISSMPGGCAQMLGFVRTQLNDTSQALRNHTHADVQESMAVLGVHIGLLERTLENLLTLDAMRRACLRIQPKNDESMENLFRYNADQIDGFSNALDIYDLYPDVRLKLLRASGH